jgi:hypothetical protein
LLSDLVGYGFAWSVNAVLAGIASIMVLRLRPRGLPPTAERVTGSDVPLR